MGDFYKLLQLVLRIEYYMGHTNKASHIDHNSILTMKKNQKRKLQLQQRTLNESLEFQTMYGARQKFELLTPEIEERLREELMVFINLRLEKDLLTLRDAMDKVKQLFGFCTEPCKGILAGSYVAFSLAIESTNPMQTEAVLAPKDFQISHPLALTVCYDNEVRNEVVNWMKV